MNNSINRKIVILISVIIISAGFIFPEEKRFKDISDIFSLKSPFVLSAGKTVFILSSDLLVADGGLTEGRIYNSEIILGLPWRSEFHVRASYIGNLTSETATLSSQREFPFSDEFPSSGAGYFSLGIKKNLFLTSNSGIGIYSISGFPLSGEKRGVTTGRSYFQIGITGSAKLFNGIHMRAGIGKRFNRNQKNIAIPDYLLITAGFQTEITSRVFSVFQIEWKKYHLKSLMKFPDIFTGVVGIGFKSSNRSEFFIGYRTEPFGIAGNSTTKGGITAIFRVTPGRKIPVCRNLTKLNIIRLDNSNGGKVVDYTVSYEPKNATGPINYEWKCSSRGTIISGKWSPVVTIEWHSFGPGSTVVLELSNRCSTITGILRNPQK